MSTVQDIARHVLSETVYNVVRDQSQRWMMRCPCGHETSIWDMGGIRWRADGKAIRWGRCGGCGERYFGQLYQRQSRQDHEVREPTVTRSVSEVFNSIPALAHAAGDDGSRNSIFEHRPDEPRTPSNARDEPMNHFTTQREIVLDQPRTMVRLWIDGVGCWLLCPAAQLTLGGPVEPGSKQPTADLCLMANLSRLHATIERSGDSYRLQTAAGEINGRTVRDETFLKDGDILKLGQHVQMRFRQPSVLSASATLSPEACSWPRMFTGSHTPATVDGIVLMDEVCLLGPGSDAHVPCPDWDEKVILHRRDGQLWCRTPARALMDGRPMPDAAPLGDGAVVSGDVWRFRAERIDV
ncbi:MAG: hypothetical protein KF861_08100 [Planctomycetaceae bacterium]|nr:hypothetical protein [Planctomycetaceae bacterium]